METVHLLRMKLAFFLLLSASFLHAQVKTRPHSIEIQSNQNSLLGSIILKVINETGAGGYDFSLWPCRTCVDIINLIVTDVDNPVYEQAANSITSTATVEASFFNQTKHVYYKAGNYIELQEGFEAREGGFFEAGIGDCGEDYFDTNTGIPASEPVIVSNAPSEEPREEAAFGRTLSAPEGPTALRLYPNPANTHLTVELSRTEGLQNATLHVFDLTGRLLMSRQWNGESPREELDISRLAAGSYFIRLQSENQPALQERFLKIDD